MSHLHLVNMNTETPLLGRNLHALAGIKILHLLEPLVEFDLFVDCRILIINERK